MKFLWAGFARPRRICESPDPFGSGLSMFDDYRSTKNGPGTAPAGTVMPVVTLTNVPALAPFRVGTITYRSSAVKMAPAGTSITWAMNPPFILEVRRAPRGEVPTSRASMSPARTASPDVARRAR